MAADLAAGVLNPKEPERQHTLNDLLDEVLERYWCHKTRLEDTKSMIERYVRPQLGEMPLAHIDTPKLQDWYNSLGRMKSERTRRPLSWQTREHILNKLRSALSRAVEHRFSPRFNRHFDLTF